MLMYRTEVAASNVHGLGCFLLEPVRRGAVVWGLTLGFDQWYRDDQLELLAEPWRDFVKHYGYLSSKDGRWVLPLDNARFMNHAPLGHCTLVSDRGGRDVAVRDLRVGDELTCDYRTFDADFERKLAYSQVPGGGIKCKPSEVLKALGLLRVRRADIPGQLYLPGLDEED